MILTHADNEFRALCSFIEKDIPKAAGFRWNPARKVWYTGDAERARRLQDYADSAARHALAGTEAARSEAIAASKAADADIDIPAPPGLNYLPYQRAGIAYALKRRAVLIADEMGLGKTIQAIGVVNALLELRENSSMGDTVSRSGAAVSCRRILVVCPATLRLNWRAEWTRWHVGGIKPVVVTDTWWSGLDVAATDLFETKAFAIIMSYEGVLKWKEKLLALPIDVAIFDECHALKNGKAKRTKAVFGAYAANDKRHVPPLVAKRRIFLTGTPIVNRPAELQPLLHSIDPTGLGAADFHRRYVAEPQPPEPVNAKHYARWAINEKNRRMAELHERLRERVMVRRLKADVLTELPAKRRQMILVNVEGASAILARERAALQGQLEAFERARQEVAGMDHAAAVQRLRAFRGAAMTEISRIRHETAVAKIPAVIDHMFALLDETPKLVMFAWHHDVLDAVFEALPGAAVKLDGRDTPEDRQAAVTRFQTDPTCRLFVGSISAAGLGITLTAASVVAFSELAWTPASMTQAEDRCHRIGQRDSVLVQHLVLDGSIDQRMSRLLIEKADVIGAILDGQVPETATRPILDEVLRG